MLIYFFFCFSWKFKFLALYFFFHFTNSHYFPSLVWNVNPSRLSLRFHLFLYHSFQIPNECVILPIYPSITLKSVVFILPSIYHNVYSLPSFTCTLFILRSLLYSFLHHEALISSTTSCCVWDRGSSLRSIFPLSSDPPRFIIQRCTGKLQVNLSYLWQDNGISRPYIYTLLIGDLKKCSSIYCLFLTQE